MNVSRHISRKEGRTSPPLQPFHLSSVMSSLLFIYPSTWTQRRDTEFANLLFAIWVCRTLTTTKLCPGKPRINDNATANNDNHYHRYRGNIQGNFLVKSKGRGHDLTRSIPGKRDQSWSTVEARVNIVWFTGSSANSCSEFYGLYGATGDGYFKIG